MSAVEQKISCNPASAPRSYATAAKEGLSAKHIPVRGVEQQSEHLDCLVVTGIDEPEGVTSNERKLKDYELANEILSKVLDYKVDIDDVFRRGLPRSDDSCRPLIVKFKSRWDLRKAIANKSKLKDIGYGKVFLSLDRPREERKILSSLLKRRRKLILEGYARSCIRIRGLDLYVNGLKVQLSAANDVGDVRALSEPGEPAKNENEQQI